MILGMRDVDMVVVSNISIAVICLHFELPKLKSGQVQVSACAATAFNLK